MSPMESGFCCFYLGFARLLVSICCNGWPEANALPALPTLAVGLLVMLHQAIRHRVPLATSITPSPRSNIKQGMVMISSKVNLKNGQIKITRLVTKKVASPKPQILNQNPESHVLNRIAL